MLRGILIVIAALLASGPSEVHALITGGVGSDPVDDPGWPEGAAAVFNSPARVAWWEGPPLGGGQWHAECRGDVDALNQVLQDFARIDAEKKRIVLHDGVGHSFWLNPNRQPEKAPEAQIDWIFIVWQPANWDRLRNLPAGFRPRGDEEEDAPVPQLDIYTGGNIRFSDLKLPDGIEVVDNRLEAHGFSPEDGTVLEGTVVDLATEKPLAARVRLERIEPRQQGGYEYTTAATIQADQTGRWILKSAPAGHHRVVVEADGYVPRVIAHGQYDDQPRWFEHNTGLSRPARVSGRVTDALGAPLEDVEVRLVNVVADPGGRYDSPEGYPVNTDDKGRFVAEALPIGRATIWVRKPGYIRPGLGLEVETPADDVSLTMVRSATIIVTVDFSDEVRPEDYLVQIEPEEGDAVGRWGGTASINAEGTVKFENVPPGTYVLTGRPNPGNERQTTDPIVIELKGGEEWLATLKAK